MNLHMTGTVALICVFLSSCAAADGHAAAHAQADIQSVYTDLGGESCRKEIDRNDPNETPYLVCPGVAGYSLIVRRVDAGRQSIDILDSAERAFPLSYQEFVSRHMFTLEGTAEWRIALKDGKQVPVGLIVRVQLHEDNDNPEKATRSYLAVAKITPGEACVTDRIPEGAQSETLARSAAESAHDRPCLPPQPPMTADGVVIR